MDLDKRAPLSLTPVQCSALLDVGSADEVGEAYTAAEFDQSREGGSVIRRELQRLGLIFGRRGRGYSAVRLALTARGADALAALDAAAQVQP